MYSFTHSNLSKSLLKLLKLSKLSKMSSFMISNNNNNGESCHFDKTDFCRENGLANTQKKDGKSHSRREQDRVLERQKKTEDNIKLLPNNMQRALQELVPVKSDVAKSAVKDKEKDKKNKDFGKGLGQNALTTLLSEQYNEELLVENDVRDEVLIGEWIFSEEEKEKIYWDNVALWIRYGLTKEQYDATTEYEKNCKIFNQYLDELNEESDEDPVFIQELEAKIKAFQDTYEAKQEADAKADDDNDWWIDQSLVEECGKPDYDEEEWKADCAEHLIEYYRTKSIADDRSKEEDDRSKEEDEEEWKENYAEKMLEFARQDAIDDYNDF